MARVLIVEDEDEIRFIFKRILKRSGYDVYDLPNGSDVLSLHEEQCFDVVVTDMLMPEKDGIETIMDLRRQCPNIKIIAVTGGGHRNVSKDYLIETAHHLGADMTFLRRAYVFG